MSLRTARSGGAARFSATIAAAVGFALLASGALTSCASSDAAWAAPEWEQSPGVTLLTGIDDPETLYAAGIEGPERPRGVLAAETGDLPELEFTEGRIRNDALPMQARYVEVPGESAFNTKVTELIWAAIGGTASGYKPEAHPVGSGLGDRGCVDGSLHWEAERVLSDPATAPAGETGTAITCEPVFAAGDVIGVGMRTVKGGSAGVTSDSTVVVYGDLANDTAFTSAELWKPGTAERLWAAAVDQKRRAVGSLSAALIADPPAEQLEIAEEALEDPVYNADGTVTFVLWETIVAPELEALGLESGDEPTLLLASEATARSWGSDFEQLLEDQSGKPFVGLPDWTANHPVDCNLVACVAVTYDDGPGPETPRLLDTLRAEKSAATFYLLGDYIPGNPGVVQRAADEGHELASHTITHHELTFLKPQVARDEVIGAADLITGVTGDPVTHFRPPYGSVNDTVLEAVGLPAILWSIDTNDWQKPGHKKLVARSSAVAIPGDIILFHDTYSDSVDVAGKVMRQLKDRGLTPVTVTQLFNGEVPSGIVHGQTADNGWWRGL